MQDELASAFERDRDVINLEGEKVFWYDNIQRTFTDNGHGGGRALPYGLPFATGDWRGGLVRMLLFDYPDRRERWRWSIRILNRSTKQHARRPIVEIQTPYGRN